MMKCLCALAAAACLMGCRSSFDLSRLRFDRDPVVQEEPDPADTETLGEDDSEPRIVPRDPVVLANAEGTNGLAGIVGAGHHTSADDIADNLKLGHVAAARGLTDKAQMYYERVLAADPDHAQAHHRLGVLADQRRDYEAAGRHYMAAVQQSPSDPDLLNDIGYSLLLQGQTEAAERYLKEALRAQPDHARARANLEMAQKGGEPPPVSPLQSQAGRPVESRSAAVPESRVEHEPTPVAIANAAGSQARQSGYAPQLPTPPALQPIGREPDTAALPRITPAPPEIVGAGGNVGLSEIRPASSGDEFPWSTGGEASGAGRLAPASPPDDARAHVFGVHAGGAAHVASGLHQSAPTATAGTAPVQTPEPGPEPRVRVTEVTSSGASASEFPQQTPNAASVEHALLAAQLIGMEVGPGNPFPIVHERPSMSSPSSLPTGLTALPNGHANSVAGSAAATPNVPQPFAGAPRGSSPVSAANGGILQVSGIGPAAPVATSATAWPADRNVPSAGPLPEPAATPAPAAEEDPIARFQEEMRQRHAELNELSLRQTDPAEAPAPAAADSVHWPPSSATPGSSGSRW